MKEEHEPNFSHQNRGLHYAYSVLFTFLRLSQTSQNEIQEWSLLAHHCHGFNALDPMTPQSPHDGKAETMTPTEEQKRVAQKIVSSFHARKNTGLTQLEQDIAQALQQVAEKAARAVLDKVLGCSVSIWTSGKPDKETEARCKGHEEMAKVKDNAARSAAAPFLKGKV